MKTKLIEIAGFFLLLSIINFQLSTLAQVTGFTYQGQLAANGQPANGNFDFQFRLYDAPTNGGQIPVVPVSLNVPVSNGLFTTGMDFGNNVFNGAVYWLEIAVQSKNGGGFTTLSPRQAILPVPGAIFANSASNLLGTLPAAQLSGTVAVSALPSNPNFSGIVTASSFSGSGSNVTSLNAGNISAGTLSDARLSTNAALRAGGNTFTGIQTYNGPIHLNDAEGFGQSSLGNFFVDAPFLPGGRFAVLENGNVGVGNSDPQYKLDVAGDVNLPLPATIYANGTTLLRVDQRGNFFDGLYAGSSTSNGFYNVALGYAALYSNISSGSNTAVGAYALFSNTNGAFNTANGFQALYFNTTGSSNTASGFQALNNNTTGPANSANGALALFSNTSGGFNSANGVMALFSNLTGVANTASGAEALFANIDGEENTATGRRSLFSNTSGFLNTADGYFSLYSNTNGYWNIAVGDEALFSNTSGSGNTALGTRALHSNKTGTGNIAIGVDAGSHITNGSGNVSIGVAIIGLKDETNVTRIRNIAEATIASGLQVYVSSTDQLGVLTSSERFKQNIRSMDDASDVLLSLRPVAFEYKPGLDPEGIPQFGLIAEEVAKVDPDLVARDDQHQIYSVRYQAVDAMLLNEFLKEHKKVAQQTADIQGLNQKVEAGSRKSEDRIQKLEAENAELKGRLEKLEQLMDLRVESAH